MADAYVDKSITPRVTDELGNKSQRLTFGHAEDSEEGQELGGDRRLVAVQCKHAGAEREGQEDVNITRVFTLAAFLLRQTDSWTRTLWSLQFVPDE